MELRILQEKEDHNQSLFASEECQQLLSIYKSYYPEYGFELPWVAYLVIKDNKVMGTGSFTQKPADGMVEIAYWTFQNYEGQGVASFACNELISIATNTDKNVIITAKTAPKKNASTRILEKNGFSFTKIVQDDEIGDAWLWTRNT